MDLKLLRSEIIERAKNFYWDYELIETQIAENGSYIFHFNILKDTVIEFIASEPMKKLSQQNLLVQIFKKMYLIYKASDEDMELFGNNVSYGSEVYSAYVFSALCAFLNVSRRIDSMSINQFILENDPSEKFYVHSTSKETKPASSLVDQRRKARNRALQKNAVYPKRPQWAAISKDIVYESSFPYFLANADDIVQDTYKRLGNLYNDICNVLSRPVRPDEEHKEKLRAAYKKFLSKLHKLKYKDYLELLKIILSYITRNKEYYGINLYRFERKLKPYIIIDEVKRLFICQTVDEEDILLSQSVILTDISFPKLYGSFASLPLKHLYKCAENFPGFLEDLVFSSCLILDELVEKGIFGDDWKNLFRNILNEMAEDVLYDPSQLDFTVQEGTQEKFEKLLAAPVFSALCAAAETDFENFDLFELPF